MVRDPQQELFTQLKLAIEALGYSVFDGVLPPEGTPYPFVYLGDFRQNDQELKDAVHGFVLPVIHVWHNDPHKRGTVSAMVLNIKTACRKLQKTENFAWFVQSMSARIIPDTTTAQPLLHGVIEPTFKFS